MLTFKRPALGPVLVTDLLRRRCSRCERRSSEPATRAATAPARQFPTGTQAGSAPSRPRPSRRVSERSAQTATAHASATTRRSAPRPGDLLPHAAHAGNRQSPPGLPRLPPHPAPATPRARDAPRRRPKPTNCSRSVQFVGYGPYTGRFLTNMPGERAVCQVEPVGPRLPGPAQRPCAPPRTAPQDSFAFKVAVYPGRAPLYGSTATASSHTATAAEASVPAITSGGPRTSYSERKIVMR